MNKINSVLFSTLFILIFSLSCEFEVPIKEMALAKSTITRAIEVNAKKYAPEELKKAKKHLLESHKYIKNGDSDNAKKEANNALDSANDAITKSLPLLANDTLLESKKLRDEAIVFYAEKYAPEALNLANEKITIAESLIDELKFWDSFLNSRDAIGFANLAKTTALSNKPALEELINDITEKTISLEENRGNEFASEEIGQINASLEEGKAFLNENKLKDTVPLIIKAEGLLKIAELNVSKGIAADQIRVAEESLKKAEESKYRKLFASEIEKAAGLITISKEEFDNKKYDISREKSSEALGILNSLFIEMEKKSEQKRIDTEDSHLGEGVREYTVKLNPKKRDCLWRIAYYMYKDARLWPLIYMANKDKIKDPDLIFPGQTFIIPPIPSPAKESEEKEEESKEDKVIIEEKQKQIDEAKGKEVEESEAVEDKDAEEPGDENSLEKEDESGKQPEEEKKVDEKDEGSGEPDETKIESSDNNKEATIEEDTKIEGPID